MLPARQLRRWHFSSSHGVDGDRRRHRNATAPVVSGRRHRGKWNVSDDLTFCLQPHKIRLPTPWLHSASRCCFTKRALHEGQLRRAVFEATDLALRDVEVDLFVSGSSEEQVREGRLDTVQSGADGNTPGPPPRRAMQLAVHTNRRPADEQQEMQWGESSDDLQRGRQIIVCG